MICRKKGTPAVDSMWTGTRNVPMMFVNVASARWTKNCKHSSDFEKVPPLKPPKKKLINDKPRRASSSTRHNTPHLGPQSQSMRTNYSIFTKSATTFFPSSHAFPESLIGLKAVQLVFLPQPSHPGSFLPFRLPRSAPRDSQLSRWTSHILCIMKSQENIYRHVQTICIPTRSTSERSQQNQSWCKCSPPHPYLTHRKSSSSTPGVKKEVSFCIECLEVAGK